MTEPKQLFLYHAVVSDTGSVRTNNEDAFLEVPERGLFIVSDGMGGAAAGEVASQMTIDGMRLACADLPYVDALPGGPLQRRQQVFAWFRRSLEKINTEIQDKAHAESSMRGMGCTLAAVLFQGNGVFLAHVGDSRVYLLRQDILYQMTEDHSLGQEFLSAGALTAEQVARHPQRNVLTRARWGHSPRLRSTPPTSRSCPETSFWCAQTASTLRSATRRCGRRCCSDLRRARASCSERR